MEIIYLYASCTGFFEKTLRFLGYKIAKIKAATDSVQGKG
jgi:hypothetical protein